MTSRQTVDILGVAIDKITPAEAQHRITRLIGRGGGVVFTPNSEILSMSALDSRYRAVLERADMRLPDTFGLRVASLGKIQERVPGADMAEWLLGHCEREKLKAAIIIREDGFSTEDEVRQAVKSRWPLLTLSIHPTNGSVSHAKRVLPRIKADVVLLGLGYPAQEFWIQLAKNAKPEVKLWMAVGGTADYWTGKKPRAPQFMRKLGIEWLWRLAIQPNRVFRILRAVVWFPWLVFLLKNQPLSTRT